MFHTTTLIFGHGGEEKSALLQSSSDALCRTVSEIVPKNKRSSTPSFQPATHVSSRVFAGPVVPAVSHTRFSSYQCLAPANATLTAYYRSQC